MEHVLRLWMCARVCVHIQVCSFFFLFPLPLHALSLWTWLCWFSWLRSPDVATRPSSDLAFLLYFPLVCVSPFSLVHPKYRKYGTIQWAPGESHRRWRTKKEVHKHWSSNTTWKLLRRDCGIWQIRRKYRPQCSSIYNLYLRVVPRKSLVKATASCIKCHALYFMSFF